MTKINERRLKHLEAALEEAVDSGATKQKRADMIVGLFKMGVAASEVAEELKAETC